MARETDIFETPASRAMTDNVAGLRARAKGPLFFNLLFSFLLKIFFPALRMQALTNAARLDSGIQLPAS